jgi:lysozyme
MKPVLVLALCLALAACGAPRTAPETPAGSPERTARLSAGPVIAPNFGDADPHDWTGRAPASYPVHGIDVSRWNLDVNWHAARAAGVNFAFVKATEGGDRVDPQFFAHVARAEEAGIPWGAYHFFYWCTDAATQARWFIANVPRRPGGLPPVLDLEWNPHSPTCTVRPDPQVVRAEVATFLAIVGRHYGQRPIVYSTLDFFRDNRLADIGAEEFWLRSTAAHPGDSYPGQPWVFWQYSGTGRVPGIGGDVSLNAFAGSPAAWAGWHARRAQRRTRHKPRKGGALPPRACRAPPRDI